MLALQQTAPESQLTRNIVSLRGYNALFPKIGGYRKIYAPIKPYNTISVNDKSLKEQIGEILPRKIVQSNNIDFEQILDSFLLLKLGWNDEDAEPPQHVAINNAKRTLTSFLTDGILPRSILPLVDGGIMMTFKIGDKKWVFDFYNDGERDESPL